MDEHNRYLAAVTRKEGGERESTGWSNGICASDLTGSPEFSERMSHLLQVLFEFPSILLLRAADAQPIGPDRTSLTKLGPLSFARPCRDRFV